MVSYRNHLGRHFIDPNSRLTDDEVATHLAALDAIQCTDDETRREVICGLDVLAEQMIGRTRDHQRRLSRQILVVRQARVDDHGTGGL